jgi:hypothetical protein
VRFRYPHVREDLNRALVIVGLEVAPTGKLQRVRAASTLDEAHERANRLRAILQQRGVHSAVLSACSKLILRDDNYFHAVFEVTKSVADPLRAKVGSKLDGNLLSMPRSSADLARFRCSPSTATTRSHYGTSRKGSRT